MRYIARVLAFGICMYFGFTYDNTPAFIGAIIVFFNL